MNTGRQVNVLSTSRWTIKVTPHMASIWLKPRATILPQEILRGIDEMSSERPFVCRWFLSSGNITPSGRQRLKMISQFFSYNCDQKKNIWPFWAFRGIFTVRFLLSFRDHAYPLQPIVAVIRQKGLCIVFTRIKTRLQLRTIALKRDMILSRRHQDTNLFDFSSHSKRGKIEQKTKIVNQWYSLHLCTSLHGINRKSMGEFNLLQVSLCPSPSHSTLFQFQVAFDFRFHLKLIKRFNMAIKKQ